MEEKAKSPGTDDIISSPEAAVMARPETAHTLVLDEVAPTAITPSTETKKSNEDKKTVPVAKPAKKNGPVVSRLNQYAMYDKNHPLNKPFAAIENFKGPKSTQVLRSGEKDNRHSRHIYPVPAGCSLRISLGCV